MAHYALFKLGKGHRDGQNDFENELEQIGLPSNYNRKFMAIHVSRIEEDGKTIAKIYISKIDEDDLEGDLETEIFGGYIEKMDQLDNSIL